MQYKSETENVVMLESHSTPVPKPLSRRKDPQILRIRIILGILLGLLIVPHMFSLTNVIYQSISGKSTVGVRRGSQTVQAIIPILIYGLGGFAADYYSAICLRIFAWIGITELVIMGIVIIILLFGTIATSAAESQADSVIKDFMVGASLNRYIIVAIGTAAFLLLIITVILAFKLARLIDAKKHLIAQQI